MVKKQFKILTIIGTRPDTIKLAPVIYELERRPWIEHLLCSTGQHEEMLLQVTQIFDLMPDINLNSMIPGQSLGALTSKMLGLISEVLTEQRPDCVIVHGDTTTAFCSALAAFYKQIPVVHVEAGLRTHDVNTPFPEEMNRQAIARIASLNFAPTEIAVENLTSEGIDTSRVFLSGNTVVESLNLMKQRISDGNSFAKGVESDLLEVLGFDYRNSSIVVITMHRRENIGDGIQEVCKAIGKLALAFPDTKFVFPVHLNPSVSLDVNRLLSGYDNVSLIPPLSYGGFIALLSKSSLVITDSGGIQEECVSLGKHALVTRTTTERIEGLKDGLLKVVATDGDQIFSSASKILRGPKLDIIPDHNPYGVGEISKFIVDKIEKFLQHV